MACRQTIIWTGILSIGPLETKLSEILIEIDIFIKENTFENIVWIMTAILSQSQCVTAYVAAYRL